jgi:quinol-cytochrome oxidoreductase complex cytochrome b subunit
MTDKDRAAAMISSLFLHIHPARVNRHALRSTYTFALGLIAAILFVVLSVTGLALMLYYVPYPPESYRSMKDLQFVVTFGIVLRNMHRWSAHAMVVVVFLHMCRVFWTGSYKPPREFNWVVGVLLLLLTLALSFTGYLLPWDQLAYWAITVGTNIAAYAPLVGDRLKFLLLGGHVIGPMTLLRFYVLHCVMLPLAMLLLISLHVWRVRKDGLSGAPDAGTLPVEEVQGAFPASTKTYGLMALARRPRASVDARDPGDEVFAWPHLLYRELLVALGVLVALHVTSLVLMAPLEEIADPTRTPNPAKAPWYFLGLQELVHYSALIGGVIVPTLLVLGLAVLPYVDRSPAGSGRWFAPERRAANAIFSTLVGVFVGLTIIGTLFRGANWAWVWPWK